MDLRKKGFQLPEKVYFDPESTDTYGKLYAEAFERGFGTTIGNALRRILLSSIEGAAVTSIKIPGVLHEFSSIQGVKEDVIDIILNVKQIRFKLHTDAPKVATIKVKGQMEIKGKDIVTGANLEILNPDLHIATVERDVNFKMELTVEKGRGYVSADKNKKEDHAIDVIAIDSIFTPIKKVNFWIEGARVGQATDYDRLIMEIWTDGSITPPQAITQAANILNGHISLFSLVQEEESLSAGETAEAERNENTVDLNENLFKSVDELELSVRASNCLKNADIRTIADLVQKTENEMLRGKNFGRKSLNEIKEILVLMGLHFNMKIDPALLEEASAGRKVSNAS
ncbi:MAG: DNA-directed RNA polymerase subunit alpha [Nitrospirota bacterium]|jgi:DNA-directed RNA polymerase subunit alpha